MNCGNTECGEFNTGESGNCGLSSTGANLNEECGLWTPDTPVAVRTRNEDTIREILNEAMGLAHESFMSLPETHVDGKWWLELTRDIEQIINDYL